jgi:hypothetical protein
MVTPDRKHRLRQLGWRCDELAVHNRDGSVSWQVDASRKGHTILAWGRTPCEAWEAAFRQAHRVHADGVC